LTQHPTITSPTIDLFLYDLREGLGQDAAKIQENRQGFWKKIYPKVEEKQLAEVIEKLTRLEKTEADYVELLIPDKQETFQPNLEGYYYALQLGDTYALQLDCSLVNPLNGNPLSSFSVIKQEITSRLNHQKGKIGQTWFVWCQLEKDDPDLDKIAKECCQYLIPNPNWIGDLQKQGELAGATLFELWHPPEDWTDEQSYQENFHLIIALFPYRSSGGLFANKVSINSINTSLSDSYFDLIRLFGYRNKIIWAYHQSRCLKAQLKKDFTCIQEAIKQVNRLPQQLNIGRPNLDELQKTLTDTLTILSKYATNLSDLDVQGQTMRINLENYKKRLNKITEENNHKNSEVLKKFSEFVAQKYLLQVETDHASLSLGLVLLENLITTIKGTVEIYQTKRDRTLNTTIAIAGIGLATSQVASAVILTQPPPQKDPLVFRSAAFFSSLGIGAIAMVITLGFLRLWRP